MNESIQSELRLELPVPPGAAAEVSSLMRFLSGRCRPVTAKEIVKLAPRFRDDRYIRQLVEDAAGYVVGFSGGYRLTLESSPDEVGEAAGRLIEQGKKMIARGEAIRGVYRRHINAKF